MRATGYREHAYGQKYLFRPSTRVGSHHFRRQVPYPLAAC
jgi:hypothetical protein